VKKYEDVKGIDCTTVKKGLGLNMVKMMFKKQFSTLLQEIKIGEEKVLADIDYMRIFTAKKDDNTLSDFIVVSEDNKQSINVYGWSN
jgi:hypothetical protein